MTESSSAYSADFAVTSGSLAETRTVAAARDQSSAVAQHSAGAGQQVASVAQEQAQGVAAEAGRQGKDLLAQARSERIEQAGAQQQRVAAGLRSLADEFGSMAESSSRTGTGLAADLVRQASHQTHPIGVWLSSREPGKVVTEINSLARQLPGTFLLEVAMAGLLVGRLTHGVKGTSGAQAQISGLEPRRPATLAAQAGTAVDDPTSWPSAGKPEAPVVRGTDDSAGCPAFGEHR